MATDNPTKKVKNRCVMQAVFPPKKHLYAIRCKRKILRLHLSVEPSCTRKILRIMRIAKVIAAAVPTISFGQNLVTEKPKVPQTQLYQGFAGLVVQFELIPTRLRVLSHSYFSTCFGLISVRFLSFYFVFLCILCVLSPFGTVLVSKFGINFLKNRRRKN